MIRQNIADVQRNRRYTLHSTTIFKVSTLQNPLFGKIDDLRCKKAGIAFNKIKVQEIYFVQKNFSIKYCLYLVWKYLTRSDLPKLSLKNSVLCLILKK